MRRITRICRWVFSAALLARLCHPAVAQVLSVGDATPTGAAATRQQGRPAEMLGRHGLLLALVVLLSDFSRSTALSHADHAGDPALLGPPVRGRSTDGFTSTVGITAVLGPYHQAHYVTASDFQGGDEKVRSTSTSIYRLGPWKGLLGYRVIKTGEIARL